MPTGIIEYTEEMVGKNHPTKADTLNRGFLIDHSNDGSHAGDICHIKTGTYTGDGSTGQAITGVGFEPKALLIFGHPSGEGTANVFIKLDQTWGDYAVELANVSNDILDNRINSLDADGFTVDDDGTDKTPNANGVTYDYVAWG